ncbi:hypothetical protein GEV33_011010 [Tenebrio molitor]|uniref:Uncharacterized protein n=1 Tax=Tenebrio molitor TaxID=7067 RepID=A0A8J6H4P8_TENMO|nr:hypothetical protein GEV33_011010 [Tenebrio molitor]
MAYIQVSVRFGEFISDNAPVQCTSLFPEFVRRNRSFCRWKRVDVPKSERDVTFQVCVICEHDALKECSGPFSPLRARTVPAKTMLGKEGIASSRSGGVKLNRSKLRRWTQARRESSKKAQLQLSLEPYRRVGPDRLTPSRFFFALNARFNRFPDRIRKKRRPWMLTKQLNFSRKKSPTFYVGACINGLLAAIFHSAMCFSPPFRKVITPSFSWRKNAANVWRTVNFDQISGTPAFNLFKRINAIHDCITQSPQRINFTKLLITHKFNFETDRRKTNAQYYISDNGMWAMIPDRTAGSDITFDFRMAELDLFGIYGGTVGKRVRNAESQPSAAIFERLRIEVVELIQLLRLYGISGVALFAISGTRRVVCRAGRVSRRVPLSSNRNARSIPVGLSNDDLNIIMSAGIDCTRRSQSKMKSSKYTQASTPNDNDYRDYQNVGVTLDDGNQNVEGHRSSEYLLKTNYDPFKAPQDLRYSPERNANRFPVDIELCNCAKEAILAKGSPAVVMNRSFSTLPKFESTNLSQFSLDRKVSKFAPRPKHAFQCEQLQKMQRKRMQSPEIINIHRGPNNVVYDGYGDENCAIKSCAYDKEFKCDDYGFRRGHPFRTSSRLDKGSFITVNYGKQICDTSEEGGRDAFEKEEKVDLPTSIMSNVGHGHPKRRAAGDGMDAEMDDPELMFELAEHLGECQCACDHVVYSPSYTACLQFCPETLGQKMCCRCPPFTTLLAYAILSILISSHYSKRTAAVDSDPALISIKSGPGVVTETFLISRHAKRVNESVRAQPFAKDVRMSDPRSATLVRKVVAGLETGRTRVECAQICPNRGGSLEVGPRPFDIDLPWEMWGRKKFRGELSKGDAVLACEIFQLLSWWRFNGCERGACPDTRTPDYDVVMACFYRGGNKNSKLPFGLSITCPRAVGIRSPSQGCFRAALCDIFLPFVRQICKLDSPIRIFKFFQNHKDSEIFLTLRVSPKRTNRVAGIPTENGTLIFIGRNYEDVGSEWGIDRGIGANRSIHSSDGAEEKDQIVRVYYLSLLSGTIIRLLFSEQLSLLIRLCITSGILYRFHKLHKADVDSANGFIGLITTGCPVPRSIIFRQVIVMVVHSRANWPSLPEDDASDETSRGWLLDAGVG